MTELIAIIAPELFESCCEVLHFLIGLHAKFSFCTRRNLNFKLVHNLKENKLRNAGLSYVGPIEAVKAICAVDAFLKVGSPSLLIEYEIAEVVKNALFNDRNQLVELPEVVVCGFVVEVKLKLFDSVV